jgi:TRAP transporter TAXI family solute receptor
MESKQRQGAPRARWARAAAVVLIVLLPVLAHQLYRRWTALPRVVTLATGPEAGRYRAVMALLAGEVESRLGVEVRLRHTAGSVENLRLLGAGEVDFALYQQGTWEVLGGEPVAGVATVARMYSEPAHLIVRADAGLDSPTGLAGRVVDLGSRESGDFAMSVLVLEHLGLSLEDVEARHMSYREAEAALRDGRLDAAIVTAGFGAETYGEMFASGAYRLMELPFVEALTLRHLFLSLHPIPAGSYRSAPEPVPARDMQTVASGALLLTLVDADTALVEEVTALLHVQAFLKRAGLRELFAEGTRFSRMKPDFALHPGALHYYEPTLRPLIDPEFADSTENLRSLLFSTLIALFLGYRWVRRQRSRRAEHRLDRYIRALLDIERRQVGLDQGRGAPAGELDQLQALLDEVTALRQEALSELTAHDLNEERGADCFVEMCHALSNKINAKITRQRFEAAMRPSSPPAGAGSPEAGNG